MSETHSPRGLLLVVSGPSGVGKGTMVARLRETQPELGLSISWTTRAPRPGEQEGVHYFYRSPEAFERLAQNGGFLEHARFGANRYGTPRSYVEGMLRAGQDVLLEIEVQGALQVKRQDPRAILIFVLPPSLPELESRLAGRATESPEVVAKRLARAHEELMFVPMYDYAIVNDDLDAAVARLDAVVLAERCRAHRAALPA